MKNETLSIVIFLVSVFISSVSQLVLKKSAGQQHDSVLKEYYPYEEMFQTQGSFFQLPQQLVLCVYIYTEEILQRHTVQLQVI